MKTINNNSDLNKAKNQNILETINRLDHAHKNNKENTNMTITQEAQDTNNINDCYQNNQPTIYDGTQQETPTLPELGIFTERTRNNDDGTTTTYKLYEGPIYLATYRGANYYDQTKTSILCTFELLDTRYDKRIYNKYQSLKPNEQSIIPGLQSAILTLASYFTEDPETLKQLTITPETLIQILKRLKNQQVYLGFTANGNYINTHIIKKQIAQSIIIHNKINTQTYDI